MSSADSRLGLFDQVVDREALERTIDRFRERRILLPTFTQLADPTTIPGQIQASLKTVGPDDPHPLNLFRVHWHNDGTRQDPTTVPEHIEFPSELTGVEARIVMMLGNRFPMIRAHKVLAAYSCLAPRLAAGAFDPTRHRAIWPSTGNYARGGIAISRIMGCRGVAVLPTGMSRERFDWLADWVSDPEDIIRTPGTESNVKEIYDACAELSRDEGNVVLNQFSEFGNYVGHHRVTGRAAEQLLEYLGVGQLTAFVAASGSSGTLGAGDYLKERHGCRIVPVEALECPTMLYNGYGEHNIQGIGDKHIPLIHNVLNADDVIAVSDRATDSLLLAFNTDEGRRLLVEWGVDENVVETLRDLGLSSICNLVASIKLAKYHGLGSSDVILTVATDGAEMYGSEIHRITERDYGDGFDRTAAAGVLSGYLDAAGIDHVLELSAHDRERIFNLGYYTWVEQQGTSIEDFDARRDQEWWRGLHGLSDRWDQMIEEFNEQTGVGLG